MKILLFLIGLALTSCSSIEDCPCDGKKEITVAKKSVKKQRPAPAVSQQNKKANKGKVLRSYKPKLDYYPDVTRDTTIYFVKHPYVYVRSGPFMSSPIVRVLPRGARIEAVGQEGVWIRLNDFEYVTRTGLSANPVAPIRRSIRSHSWYINRDNPIGQLLFL